MNLDMVPKSRDEDHLGFTMEWVRHHDRYGTDEFADPTTPQVIYDAGTYTFTREQIGTRYVLLGVRVLVDPANPDDVKQVHNLQDAIKVSQQSPGSFEVPNWEPASQKKVHDALLVFAAALLDTNRMFGPKDQVDPVRRLIGAASLCRYSGSEHSACGDTAQGIEWIDHGIRDYRGTSTTQDLPFLLGNAPKESLA